MTEERMVGVEQVIAVGVAFSHSEKPITINSNAMRHKQPPRTRTPAEDFRPERDIIFRPAASDI